MRSTLTKAVWIGLAVSTTIVPVFAQVRDNSEKQLTCANAGHDVDRARHCEIREQTLPAIGRLSIDAGRNGGATVKGWGHGQVHFDANNGGVHLKRIAGDVSGGAAWVGQPMELRTRNGGVTVATPANYSARIQAETGMGRIQSDFPLPQDAGGRSRRLDFSVGSGGAPIHITTGNGSIRLKRVESQ
jgi:hypothetical protein